MNTWGIPGFKINTLGLNQDNTLTKERRIQKFTHINISFYLFTEILRNLEYIAQLAFKNKGTAKVWLGPKLYVGKWNIFQRLRQKLVILFCIYLVKFKIMLNCYPYMIFARVSIKSCFSSLTVVSTIDDRSLT